MTSRDAHPIKERLERLIQRIDGCWIFTGNKHSGYGRITVGSREDNSRKTQQAHIASYKAFIGEIPEGLVLDHLCRNRACVNPEHLEPVTVQENIRRGEVGINQRNKTRCPQGHEYSTENTYLYGKNKLQRLCRMCRRVRNYQAFLRRRIA